LREGKNREVRKVLEQLGLTVNRLIRVAYGPFELGDLGDGDVQEVETEELRKALGLEIVAQANADFESPLEHEMAPRPHPEARTTQSRAPQDDRERKPHADRKKKQRRDRTGGPRPKYPRPKS
jgi:23S rRNA pseudouridine2605 synthase